MPTLPDPARSRAEEQVTYESVSKCQPKLRETSKLGLVVDWLYHGALRRDSGSTRISELHRGLHTGRSVDVIVASSTLNRNGDQP